MDNGACCWGGNALHNHQVLACLEFPFMAVTVGRLLEVTLCCIPFTSGLALCFNIERIPGAIGMTRLLFGSNRTGSHPENSKLEE